MKKIILYLCVVICLAAAFVGAMSFWGTRNTMAAHFGSSKKSWQAVYMTDGKVYYGHVGRLKEDFVELNDVYYIKVRTTYQEQKKNSAPNEEKSKSEKDSELVPTVLRTLAKPSVELPGPEDRMIINRDHIFYWQTLRPDSQIVQTIERFKKTGQ